MVGDVRVDGSLVCKNYETVRYKDHERDGFWIGVNG